MGVTPGGLVTAEVLRFFDGHLEALPLYEALAGKIFSELGPVTVRVRKTQISFSNRYHFTFVSFLPVRRKKDRPDVYITVTFGLDRRIDSPRVDGASEPYPNRWTHHVLVSSADELDAELMSWVKEAAEFAAGKGRRVTG